MSRINLPGGRGNMPIHMGPEAFRAGRGAFERVRGLSSTGRKPCLPPDYTWEPINIGRKALFFKMSSSKGEILFSRSAGSDNVWIAKTTNDESWTTKGISLNIRTGEINIISQGEDLDAECVLVERSGQRLKTYSWARERKNSRPPINQLRSFLNDLRTILDESRRYGAFQNTEEIKIVDLILKTLTKRYLL
jgi:hypothetical protein